MLIFLICAVVPHAGECKYDFQAWGECDVATGMKNRTGVLKRALMDANCPNTVSATKPCGKTKTKLQGNDNYTHTHTHTTHTHTHHTHTHTHTHSYTLKKTPPQFNQLQNRTEERLLGNSYRHL